MSDKRYLPPRILQAIGLILLAGFAAFWALTGRESVLLVGAAMSLILLGAYGSAQNALREATKQPPPPELKDGEG